jgi:tetratricopeptide (TPR) repeat protein
MVRRALCWIGVLTWGALTLVYASAVAQTFASDAARKEAFQHYRNGQEMLSAEQWDKAAEEFGLATARDPLFTDAYFGLGQAHMGARRFASAVKAFEDTIEAARTLHQLRERDRVTGDRQIDDQLRTLREAMRTVQQQKTGQVQNQLLQIEARIRELERSKSSLGSPFEAPAEVLLALGSAQFRNGNREAAETRWSEAVKVNSKLGEGWNNLAVIYLTSGRKKEAEDAIKNAERTGFRVNPKLKEDIKAMK